MPSFTVQVPNLQALGPVVDVMIMVGSAIEGVLQRNGQIIPTPIPVSAMIDTGATGTVVKPEIVEQLNLTPIGVTRISTATSTNVQCYEYILRILFPNNIRFETVAIAVPLLGQHIQGLIGRDVLSRAILIYTGPINSFTVSV